MMPPDEIEDFSEVNLKIIMLLEEFNFTATQSMMLMTMLTCTLFQALNEEKDVFMKKISEIWDIVK